MNFQLLENDDLLFLGLIFKYSCKIAWHVLVLSLQCYKCEGLYLTCSESLFTLLLPSKITLISALLHLVNDSV